MSVNLILFLFSLLPDVPCLANICTMYVVSNMLTTMCIVQRAGYVRRTANTYIVHVRHIITYKLKDIANDQIHGWTGQEISARRLWGLRGEPPDGQGETLEN